LLKRKLNAMKNFLQIQGSTIKSSGWAVSFLAFALTLFFSSVSGGLLGQRRTYPTGISINNGNVTYCQNASSSQLTLTLTTVQCGSSGSNANVSHTEKIYVNTVNSTVGGTEVATLTNTLFATNATYTPPTTNVGVFYYYAIVSWSTDGCATGGSITSSVVQVTVSPPPTTSTNGGNQTLAACATTTTLTGNTPITGTGTWTVSPTGPTINNLYSPNSTVSGLVPGTTYTFTWTIANSPCASSSSTMTVLAPAGPGCWNYCASNATSTADSRINRVQLNTIDQTSPNTCQVYTDYTAVNTNVVVGTSYTLAITKGTCGSNYAGFFGAWIDWNNDGDFDDAGEQVILNTTQQAAGVLAVQSTFSIPVGAALGATRMRCIFREGTVAPSPCGTYTYGETEDYTINIVDLSPCSGVINPGTISLSPTVGCSSLSLNLSATNSDVATGLSYQWEKSTTSTFGSVTNVGSAQSSMVSSVSDVPGGTCYYRLKVQCNGGTAYYSNSVMFEAINSVLTYCEPNSTSTGFPITNVTFAGINNSNVISDVDYQDFTCISGAGVLTQGSTYPLAISFRLSGSNANVFALNVFFDWNQDGDFDDVGEQVQCGGYSGSATSATFNGNITVPASAASGVTRMRVMHKYNSYSTPCFDGGNNLNAQDYLLKVGTVITALPVELIAFTAQCQNDDVEVNWSTATEHNSQYFALQVSEDGYSWSDLYVIEAAGFSTTVLEYSYIHKNAARTKMYYRLRQYDYDGAVKTYNPIMSNCSTDETIFMSFPNPSADAFTVVVNDELLSGTNVLTISDASGKLIYSIAVDLENGSGSFALEGLDLPAGLYYLQLNNGSHTSRVIKHSFR
jgi:hypothetical protein